MLQHTDLDPLLNDLVAAPHWYVGFSGGVDSTVLLHLLHEWRLSQSFAPPLSAIHVNHALQPTAPEWERHCERVCQALNLPIVVCNVDVGAAGSGEAAARDVRYRAFEAQMQPGAVLFLAQHLDDQVETVFLRLLRGAGVEGLAAMPRTRTLGAGKLVRPLLDCTRSQIEAYAQAHGLDNVEDPSNRDTGLDRNFLRSEVLPLLATRWPAYRQSIARTTEHMIAAAKILTEEVGVPATVHSVMGDEGLAATDLLAPTEDVAAIRLRAWLRAAGCRAPDQSALVEFLRQLRSAAEDASPKLDCGDYILQRYAGAVYRLPTFTGPPPSAALRLAPGERKPLPGVGEISLVPATTEGLRLDPEEELSLKWRRGGERCRLPGATGSRSLKHLLQEWNIPPWWRDRLPLIFLGEELIAVADMARCESDRWCTSPLPGQKLWDFRWKRLA